MSSYAEYQKNNLSNFNNGQLLYDIEEISKALYLHKTPSEDLFSTSSEQSQSLDNAHHVDSIPSVFQDDLLFKDKKSSLWKWKPLQALTHIRQRRFYCCFFLQVLTIEGLPPQFNDLSLCVQWKRKDDVLRTRPARVFEGRAEFEETLMHRCSVYGSRSGTRNSAKYQPKLFLLSASVVGAPMIDIGKHWVDLTRLLPLTLEELEEERRTSGKWTTCFKLAGKAKGAMMNVSFGFSLLKDKSKEPYRFVKIPDNLKESRQVLAPLDQFDDFGRISTSNVLHKLDSLSKISSKRSHASSRSMDFTTIDGTSTNSDPDLARSVSLLYKKLEEQKLDISYEKQQLESPKTKCGHILQSTHDGNEYASDMNEVEKKVPLTELFNLEEDANASLGDTVIETIEVSEIFKDIEIESETSEDFQFPLKFDDNLCDATDSNDEKHVENGLLSEEAGFQELENAINNFLTSEAATISSSLDVGKIVNQERNINRISSFKEGKLVRSLSLDRLAESVANDFLNMLGTDQCELDMNFDNGKESFREHLIKEGSIDSVSSMFSFNTTEVQTESSEVATTSSGTVFCSDDFQLSLVTRETEDQRVTHSLRSKRNFKVLENLETETLMRQWGLDEEDFHNSPHIAAGGFGSPIHPTVEAPIDLPPLGEGLGPLVRTRDCGFLRSMNPSLFSNSKNGARLVMQISRSVVLPEVMGSDAMEILECWASVGVQQMCSQASELMPLDDITGKTILQVMQDSEHTSEFLQRSSPCQSVMHHESLGMQEKTSDYLESGLGYTEINSDYASPEALVPTSMTKFEVLSLEGLKIQSSMSDEGAPSGIRLPSSKNMASSGTSGIFSCDKAKRPNDVDISELINLSLSLDEWMKLDAGNNGTFGKKLTIVQSLQLRDPFRNYEMVGSSMLLLMQVEPIMLCGEGYATMFKTNNEKNHDVYDSAGHSQNDPMFKIRGVHVAGLNVEPGEKPTWTSRRLQQSGIRWLLSSGMGTSNKRPASKWKAITVSSVPMMKKEQSGAILWSISSNVQDAGKEQTTYSRNPDIIFPR
ncbi:hypothetical protein Leryth_004979 [Lithospermum erythrorhizon]|nr:hypothetical protein Leryth_004979 [Lithospermum erythrorhizon]